MTFTVTTSSGQFVADAGGQISSNGLYYTDADGKIILSGLDPDTYVVTETASIPGYVLDSTPQTVVVHADDTQTLTFTNKPAGGLVMGYGLLVLFFAIGIFRSASGFRDFQRPEHLLRHFIYFVLAKLGITYGMDLLVDVFDACNGIVATAAGSVGGLTGASVALPQEIADAIGDVGFLASIPLWLVTLLGSLLITVLAFIMILTVYGRFFKIYMYAALSPVALASFAGEGTSHFGKAFLRSYIGVCMEGAVIVLACIIFSAFSSSGTPTVDSSACSTATAPISAGRMRNLATWCFTPIILTWVSSAAGMRTANCSSSIVPAGTTTWSLPARQALPLSADRNITQIDGKGQRISAGLFLEGGNYAKETDCTLRGGSAGYAADDLRFCGCAAL